MHRKKYFTSFLCSVCMLLVLTSCRSAREPAAKIGATYDYPIMLAPQEYSDTESPGHKEARQVLIDDLADAIVRAIREGHIQSLRGRIRSGEERFWAQLARKGGGGSIPTLMHRPGANRWTGIVISEIQTSIKLIRQELKSMGIDPKTVRRVAPCAITGKYLPYYASFRIRGDSGQILRIPFMSTRRKTGDESFVWVLEGGWCFGGIYHTWLTAEEEDVIKQGYWQRTWTKEHAKLVLKKRVNYRYMAFRFEPDLFRERARSAITFYGSYKSLTKEGLERLRHSITYSEWPNNYNKGKEVMKILFDENGIAKQIFLHGKEVKADD